MAVSDVSPIWTVEQMIWNALESDELAQASDLDTWRGQQNPKGNAGTNYKTGAIPDHDALDTPALYFQTGDVTTPAEIMTMRSLPRYHAINVVGELHRESHREAEVDKLVKRFQHLVERTLGAALRELLVANSEYLPSGVSSHILEDILPGSPIFPDWTDPAAIPIFIFPIYCMLINSDLWLL